MAVVVASDTIAGGAGKDRKGSRGWASLWTFLLASWVTWAGNGFLKLIFTVDVEL